MLPASNLRPGSILAVFSAWLFATGFAGAAVNLPTNVKLDKVDFERHVMGIFGKMGCNAGSCHGSFQGKGGFRLSLFGYDPEKDYITLTREMLGRRINRADPDHSLLLLKATGQTDHGGGRRFDAHSWQYQLLRDWIVSGTPWRKGSGDVAGLTITPPEVHFTKTGEAGDIAVRARFADGSEEDITSFCDYRVQDDALAEVTSLGKLKSLRPGDTALVVSYRGNIVPVRVMVPVDVGPGFRYPEVPAVNYVDREVLAKLRLLNIVPAELAGDLEFLRRVTIDTIGCLPSPDEVRAFAADRSPEKRAKKIDELLNNPLHAALWATKVCDITGNNTDALENPQDSKAKRSQMWFEWLRKRLAANEPYDEIVRGILCATSREGLAPEEWVKQVKTIEEEAQKGCTTCYADRKTLDMFWRRQQAVTSEQWGEKTAAAFLGVRLECAQCHKHPFDRWTQTDYRSFANVFGQVALGASPEAKKMIDTENNERRKQADKKRQIAVVREVFVGGKPSVLRHPDTNEPLPAKALGGPEIETKAGEDPRAALMEWMRSPENPFFARSFVNRVWGHYFGVGLVDPVDDFSLANPPSNPRLLDALAQDFVDHGYDIRHLERTILNARTYQLSAVPNATNRLDRNNYSHSFVRRMMAEVVVDVLNSALGVTEDFGKGASELPPGSHAIQVGGTRVQNQNVNFVFRTFGRPPRTSACDCERAMEPALPQTLYLMTDAVVLSRLQAPTGRLQQLLKGNKTDEQVLDELFLATLTRLPLQHEKENFLAYRTKKTDRQAAFVDTLWALINTREFILNH
jgi:hypothetical protein